MRHGLLRILVVSLLFGVGLSSAAAAEAVPQARPARPAQETQLPPEMAAWIGKTVTSVRMEVEGQPLDNTTFALLLEVRVGATLTEVDLRESLAHVRSLGRYELVTVSGRAERDGVALLFSLVPQHPLARLEFRGNTGLDGRSLERAVLEQVGGRLGTISSVTATEAVTRVLADEGFFRPTVTPSLERTHVLHTSVLVLTIDAGPRQRIGEITMSGESPLSREEVLRALNISTGDPYRRRAIEDALRSVAEGLRARRHYEAAASHFATGDGEVVNLTVNVEAGPIFDIVVTGDPLPRGGVDEWIPIRRENSADADLLEDSALRIKWALQAEGYWKASVDVKPEETPSGNRIVVNVSRGRKYFLRDVTVSGNTYLSTPEIVKLLALTPGEVFRQDVVTARVQVLSSAYGAAGYAAVIDIQPEEITSTTADVNGAVVVHLTIKEGPARTVGALVIVGADRMTEAAVRGVIRSQAGQPLRDQQMRQDRDAVETLYRNAGFDAATVRVDLTGDPNYTSTFTIVEGRQLIVDHVIVTGNSRVHTDTIMRMVTLRAGEPYGQAARSESLRQLNEMAIFRRVSISAVPAHASDDRVDVVVLVEESPATTIGYGGGLEFGRSTRTVVDGFEDRFEIAPRGFFEVGRRNLFGGNRSINLFSRLSLRPRNDPEDPERDGRGFGISEYRVTGSYREARAWRSNTDLVVSTSVERAIRTSFTYERRGVTAEALRRLTSRTTLFGRYALDSTRLFDTRISEEDQPLIDRLFPQIRLSSFSAGIVWDRRDNILDPTAGGWLSVDAELAGRSIGSQVGFAKAFMQATGFRRVTRRGRVVLAARVQMGMARGFERQVVQRDASGVPIDGPDGQPLTTTVADLPAGRRFFAGGSTSVRGFQQDRLGVPAILNDAGFSNGGNGLVILNGEVRTRLFSTVFLVGFMDGGNVFRRVGDIRADDFRGSAGFGIRYRSPLGPLRLDLGFKLDRRFVAGKRERGWEFHLSIGEAF